MKRRSLVFAMAALAAALALFAGCSRSGSSSSSAQDGSSSSAHTISYWNINVTEPGSTILERVLSLYASDPVGDYVIDSVSTVNDRYKERLIVAMSSGQCPDMYTSWSGGPLFEYVDSGFAQPLEDLLNASSIKDMLMPAGLEQVTYKGHIWGIPYSDVQLAGVHYNKDIFARYGLEEPKTVSELERICDVLVENGIIPFALANRNKWTGSMYFMCLATRIGGLEPFQNAVAGTGSFEDECFIQAGEIIQDWVRKGYFPEGVNSLDADSNQDIQLIYQERAAMLLGGSWNTASFARDNREFYESKIGWFSFPAYEGSGADPAIQIGTVGAGFLSINAGITGEKLEAAWKAIEAHLADEIIELEIASGSIPPILGIEERLTDPLVRKIAQTAADAPAIQLWYDQYLPPIVSTAHLDGLQEVFGLTKTPAQAQAEMQAAMAAYNAGR